MFRFLFAYLSLSFFFVPQCIYSLFGKNVTFDQILYHTSFGVDGVKGADSSLLLPVLCTIFFPFVLIIIYIILLKIIIRIRQKGSSLDSGKRTEFFLKIDKFFKSSKTIFLLFVFSVSYMFVKTNMFDSVKLVFGQDLFSTLYKDPSNIEFKNVKNKKNLLLIYVESLENHLMNEQIFNANLIEPIDKLNGVHIPGFYPAPGTGWSIAGMVASQCAIPLKIKHFTFPHKKGRFFPNLTCLGDVLKQFGYRQYFLAGHHLGLSGTSHFYESHGYEYNFGKTEWLAKQIDPKIFTGFGGGLHDDTLLEEAKKIILENQASQLPFNLTLMTVDTHAKEGFISSKCPLKNKMNGFRGAFQCSSHFIASFIQDLEDQNLLDNTVVVLMGDHPFMESPEKSDLFPNPRHIYIKFMHTNKKEASRTIMTHFDVAPSILDLMGFLESSDSKFGLGFSVFSDNKTVDYETHYAKVINQQILHHSQIYDSFW